MPILLLNVTEDGHYDLDKDELPPADQYTRYQLEYWGKPKRCSVWRVDPVAREVGAWVDLPSRGDTCFPEAIPLGGGRFLVFNYTSPLDGEDVGWATGQTGPTLIYRTVVSLPN